jgi:hypothetical protein
MVEVFKIGEEKPTKHFGEVVFDDGESFRIHSSDRAFSKSEYKYVTKL